MTEPHIEIVRALQKVRSDYYAYKHPELLRLLINPEYLRDLIASRPDFSFTNLDQPSDTSTLYGMKIIETSAIEGFEIVMRMNSEIK